MRLLFQILVLSTINLFLRFIAFMLRIILPLLIATLRVLCIPVFMSFTATVVGPREYVSRVSYEWAKWLIDRGGNPREISRITSLCRLLVTATIVVGWVFSALFTVAIFLLAAEFFI